MQRWLGKREAGFHAFSEEPDLAIEALDRARRLSPFDPLGFLNSAGLAIAHLAARQFEQAAKWASRALSDQPRLTNALRVKIVANAHLGRLDEARTDVNRMLVLDPGLTITRYRALSAHYMALEILDLYVVGLRLAGLPEG